MNGRQHKLLLLAAVVPIAMVFYPPFVLRRNGYTIDKGYAWLVTPPRNAAVNIPLLTLQELVVAAAFVAGYFYLGRKEQIRKEAVKCRYCGEWLGEKAKNPDALNALKATATAPTEPPPDDHKQHPLKCPSVNDHDRQSATQTALSRRYWENVLLMGVIVVALAILSLIWLWQKR